MKARNMREGAIVLHTPPGENGIGGETVTIEGARGEGEGLVPGVGEIPDSVVKALEKNPVFRHYFDKEILREVKAEAARPADPKKDDGKKDDGAGGK